MGVARDTVIEQSTAVYTATGGPTHSFLLSTSAAQVHAWSGVSSGGGERSTACVTGAGGCGRARGGSMPTSGNATGRAAAAQVTHAQARVTRAIALVCNSQPPPFPSPPTPSRLPASSSSLQQYLKLLHKHWEQVPKLSASPFAQPVTVMPVMPVPRVILASGRRGPNS
jgi:hypothetical protein